MEKIKNILSGNKQEENIASPSDQTTGTSSLQSGTGQTSRLTSGTTRSQGLTGEGSHLAQAGHRDNLGSTNTSGVGQNTTSSGLGNTQNTGISSELPTVGPHSSNLANKADPRVDSDRDGSKTVGTTGGVGSTTSAGYENTTSGAFPQDAPANPNAVYGRYDGDNAARNTSRGTDFGSSTTNPTSAGGGYESNTAGNISTGANYGSSTTNPTSSGAEFGSSTSTTGPQQSSHLGRDAAVGAGGVGLAEHEHHKHQNERGTGIGGTTSSTTHSGNTGFSAPPTTEAGNRLDPSVNTSSGAGLESAHHHSKTHGGGAEEADQHHGSHLGRDAAVGAGGAALAEHEHRKHEHERGTGVGTTTGNPGLGQSTGAYDHTTGTGQHQSHIGRDAALVGGGAGLAEHEHHKHQNERGTGVGSTATSAYDNTTGSSMGQSHLSRDAGLGAAGVGAANTLDGPAPNTAGPHKQDWLNKLDPRVNSNPDQPQSTGHGPLKVTEGQTGTAKSSDSTTRTVDPTHHGQSRTNELPGHDAAAVGALGGAGAYEAAKHHHGTESGVGGSSSTTAGPYSSSLDNKADPTVDSDRSKDHHYGRDAGVAGGVGAAAYEVDKHHQKHDKDLTASEREAKKDHKHELKEEKKEAKREHKESKGGLLSFLHRDKNKKYTPEEEAEFDRQEHEHNSHKGRDALGGAAVGGAAYEAEKHHGDQQHGSGIEGDNNKPLPTAPGNHGVGTGAGTQNALAGDHTTSTSSSHHLGTDAALVGGAGALGEHEHHKHSGATGTGHNATPLDEIPRGTDIGDKLHGVERNRGVPGPTGFPHEQGYGTGSSATGTSSTGTGQHHYGRDATAAGGAAALGEHEHRKHEHENVGLTGSDHGQQSHLGRDAAGVGAAGLVGEHEYRKHDMTSGEQYGTTGQQSSLGGALGQEYGTTGTGFDTNLTGTGPTNTSNISGDRNRLHKDPPANHPAAQVAQGGVLASGAEKNDLSGDSNTGVANAPGQGNVNVASNY